MFSMIVAGSNKMLRGKIRAKPGVFSTASWRQSVGVRDGSHKWPDRQQQQQPQQQRAPL
jgi:hypothetical protein